MTINVQTFKITEIDSIVLSLYTRTDMCPFCSMFLVHKLQERQQKLMVIPVIALVTSRQEYRCAFPFIIEKPYHQGYSMRSFARRVGDDGSSLMGLRRLQQKDP